MNTLFKKMIPYRYFEGWYFKHQNNNESIALIPALHINEKGNASASLQIITDTQAFHVDFPAHSLRCNRKKLLIRLGKNTFTRFGCQLNVKSKDVELKGYLKYGPFTPPMYDIMGPFRMVPFMECRHSVFSLSHQVDGRLMMNGKQFQFNKGNGYIEGDRGHSFPRRYVWTQCSWQGNSIMLSVAEIPFGLFSFTGCIGFIYLNGKEYRIATYCGVKLRYISNDTVILRQGTLVLKIKMLCANSHLLRAPHMGNMIRTIHESISCTVRYTCYDRGQLLFDFISEKASFENNWE